MLDSAFGANVFAVEFCGCGKLVIPSQGFKRLQLLHEINRFINRCRAFDSVLDLIPWNYHPIFISWVIKPLPKGFKIINSFLGICAILIRHFKDILVNLGHVFTGRIPL